MKKKIKEHKDLSYRPFAMRLSEEVRSDLTKKQRSSKKSWNLFIKDLLDNQ